MKRSYNKPAAPNPARAFQFHFDHLWRRVGDPERSTKMHNEELGTRLVLLSEFNTVRKNSSWQIPSYAIKDWLRTAKCLRGLLLWTLAGICFVPFSTPAQPGIPLWTNCYNGSGNGSDNASAVAVDSSGNVYVTGSSRGSGTRLEYATVAYSSTGAPLWTNGYAGTGNYDDSPKALVANGGHVYVTGSCSGLGSFFDYSTLAYSAAGAPLWTNRYRGFDTGLTWPWGIAADKNNGNVYVTGFSPSVAGDWDYLTIAYSSSGAALWTNRYAGNGQAVAVALAGNGNVVVTGTSGHRYVTIAYSDAGAPLWTNFYTALGNTDNASGLTIDTSGNVYVTGSSLLTGGGYDFATVAYSSTGTALWTNRYDGPIHGDDSAAAVAVDSNGQVYVTGSSAGFTDSDYVTIAYSSAGMALWTNRYDGSGHGYDEARGLVLDGSGNVYVTGLSYSSSNNYDYATIAYSSAGVPLWTNLYNGTGNGDDLAQGITIDNGGNVLVTGSSVGSGGNTDFVTIKYAGQGPPPVPIPIQMQRVGNELRLSWTNIAFLLQSAPSATGPFTNVAGATSPHSQFIAGPQQFFRLKW